MTKKITVLALAAMLAATYAVAQDRVVKPHSTVLDAQLSMQLREEMGHLEGRFVEMEDAFTGGKVNYETILKGLEQMQATQRTIERIAPKKGFAEPLKGLSSQLEKVRKAAKQESPMVLRREMDGLYDACFRCHAMNAPKYN